MFRILSLLFSLIVGWGVNVSVTPNDQAGAEEANNNGETITATQAAEESDVPVSDSLSRIAQCLTQKGARFYGAYWCPHCADQKKLFGDAMQYIEYVECDQRGENSKWQLCDEAEIQAYPTWIFGNGERSVGAYKPEELAEKAGCNI